MDDSTPGVCVEAGDRTLSWSPVKLIRTGVKAVSDTEDSSDSDTDVNHQILMVLRRCLVYVPGFEIETKDDVHALWIPVAHQ